MSRGYAPFPTQTSYYYDVLRRRLISASQLTAPVSLLARVTSGQVCRPHFHSPLHPWISAADGKPAMVPHPAHGGPSWCPPFPSKPSPHHPSPPGMGVHAPTAPSHSSPHLFSFPPTPPKDATPDNVSGASAAGSGNPAPGSVSGSAGGSGTEFGSSSSNAIACSSVGSDSVTNSSEAKPYYVGSSHHNMITSLGSALSNCSSSKPREGSAN